MCRGLFFTKMLLVCAKKLYESFKFSLRLLIRNACSVSQMSQYYVTASARLIVGVVLLPFDDGWWSVLLKFINE